MYSVEFITFVSWTAFQVVDVYLPKALYSTDTSLVFSLLQLKRPLAPFS
jgi:hypothetical protein